jgi:hypothetical protein
MLNLTKTIAITSFVALIAAAPVHAGPSAQDAMVKTDVMMKPASTPLSFAKKKYKVSGTVTIVEENGQTILRLSEDFKTKSGPDLKIFLSPQSASTVTGRTAVNGSISLGALASNKGGSDYVLPAGVSLSNFQSILVHCEAYSVLWAAAELG